MERIIRIKTKKNVSQDLNGNVIVEEIDIKLSDWVPFADVTNKSEFAKFIKCMVASKFKETPKVISVLEDKKNKDTKIYQDIIDKKYQKEKSTKTIDYKRLSEQQAIELKKVNDRLTALEEKSDHKKSDNRIILETKAEELNIKFRENIGDDKLLKKIKEIEPEFELN